VLMPSRYCFSFLLGTALCLPALGQNASPPANSAPPSASGQTAAPPSQQVARTVEDIRERILLDRVEQMEKRIAELEARDAAAQAAASPAPATAASSAPAAQETPVKR
jgi:hypothetical protein